MVGVIELSIKEEITLVKLSVITITYNNPDHELKTTLDSVANQKFELQNFEHIIVDNLSSGNTKKIICEYQKNAKHRVIYIREKDTGRYNAMNKGIKKAAGDYLLFLNAGDSLYNSKVLDTVFSHNFNEDIVYGDIIENGHNKHWSLKGYQLNQQFFRDRTIFHQAAFIKKTLFEKYGLYDETYKIVGDFDFFIKCVISHKVSTRYLSEVISQYDTHGISSSASDLLYAERSRALAGNNIDRLYNYFKYFYYSSKKYFPNFIIKLQQRRLQSKPKV